MRRGLTIAPNGGRLFTFAPWFKDKYGVSWQIIATVLGKLLGDKDPVKAGRVMKAMLQMMKLDIQRLVRAYERP